jgi:uncharacterized protein (TIGR02186 family)
MKSRATLLVGSLVLWAAVLAAQPGVAPADASVTVRPAVISMDTFYAGAAVEVEGRVPAGCGVVVAVKGPATEETFNKKGRFGPIWANAGKVRISGVPSLHLAFASGSLDGLLGREERDRYQLDRKAIEAQMVVEPASLDQPEVRQNYVKLKSGQGVLRLEEGAVRVEEGPEGGRFRLSFRWPKVAPPAGYTVEVYACREGRVVARAETPLQVVKVGFPEKMASMARDRAVLYGILCVLVATLAGLGIDFVASKLGGKVSAH